MPVQINELVIRVNIIEADEKKSGSKTDGSGSRKAEASNEDIIKECVAIVMELLNNKNQR